LALYNCRPSISYLCDLSPIDVNLAGILGYAGAGPEGLVAARGGVWDTLPTREGFWQESVAPSAEKIFGLKWQLLRLKIVKRDKI